jgi:hypothetical protein
MISSREYGVPYQSPSPRRPSPLRCDIASRSVNSRVTHGSYSWNHGRCFVTLSSSDSLPSSASIPAATAVKNFELEPMAKTVRSSTASGFPTARTPNPLA